MIGLNHYLVLAAFIFCMGIFVMVTKRAVRYRRQDLLEWIRARQRRSTSDGR